MAFLRRPKKFGAIFLSLSFCAPLRKAELYLNPSIRLSILFMLIFHQLNQLLKGGMIFWFAKNWLCFEFAPQFPWVMGGRKNFYSMKYKTNIFVWYKTKYLNWVYHNFLWRAFWVIVILEFPSYKQRVDFKRLISN